jgi:two-component system, OmpR family, response regulator
MTPTRILVVEDDAQIGASIVKSLRAEGFEVELDASGAGAAERVRAGAFDLVVLDLMLPGADGFDILADLQHRSSTPVIVLTARTDLEDRLLSFERGAVDYVSKPFWMKELLARIRARTHKERAPPKRVVDLGGATFDVDARVVVAGGEELRLTRTELDVLAYLVLRKDRALSREQIAADVLPAEGDGRTVDAHVAKLRKKLGEAGQSIQTVWGVGYRFSPGKAVR